MSHHIIDITMHNSRTFQWLFGVYVRAMLVIVSTFFYIFFVCAQLFVSRTNRQSLWRHAVKKHNALMLRIAGIRLHLHNVPEKLEHASLIISNHPTMLDGFIYFSLFGPDVIPVTGPARYFAFPFGRVFKHMGAIDIARTDEEEERFPDSYTRKQSVEKMKQTLSDGQHVLLFPEGHIEVTRQLYYVHSGAARVSLATGRPLTVFGVTGAEHVFVDDVRMRPGTIHVHFHEYIHSKKSRTKTPKRADVISLQHRIEDAFVSFLPHAYVPDYVRYARPTKVAAFIDIDNTLYAGIFSADVITYLLKKGAIPRRRGWYVLWLLSLEILGIIPHRLLMRYAHRVLKGMSEKEVLTLAQEYFDGHAKHKLNDVMEALIKNHAERGHTLVIVTEVIEPLARLFGNHINAQDVIGTQLIVSSNTYTGEILMLDFAEDKARNVHHYAKEHNIDLKKCYAYGDSFTGDRFMLACVGHPNAVNPSRRLKRLARQKGWKIIPK